MGGERPIHTPCSEHDLRGESPVLRGIDVAGTEMAGFTSAGGESHHSPNPSHGVSKVSTVSGHWAR